jgi:hypothetical protein
VEEVGKVWKNSQYIRKEKLYRQVGKKPHMLKVAEPNGGSG